jgi:hypothetical protein
MKNKFIFGTLALLALAIFTWSFDAPTAPAVVEAADSQAFAVGEYLNYNYRKDTLTNAEVNTLNVGRRDNSIWNTVTTPANLLSLYTYDINILPLSLSGTMSVKVVLDGANTTSGTISDWCAIDSITGTTAARVLQLRSTDATKNRYRLRVIGSGTQSSTYQIWSAWKKKN